MSSRTKFFVGAILIIAWIGFWRWADSTLPNDSTMAVVESPTSKESCVNYISKKRTLEDSASDLANEANNLQRTLLRERFKVIIDKDVLPLRDDNILTEYLSYDLKKIVAEKSDAFGEAMRRNIELRPEVILITSKLINRGELEPYLFKEVQEMGQAVRTKFQEARNLTQTYPDCFKSTLEIDKLIDEATKKLEQGEPDNGWITKKSAEELINSIL